MTIPEPTPLLIALRRLNRTMDGSSSFTTDIVVDLAVGFEAMLSGEHSPDLSLRLRMRAADILGRNDDPAELVYDDIKALYDLRSDVIHGRGGGPGDLAKYLGRVRTKPEANSPAEQCALALDRWRDLLRRSILARAALDGEPALWPLGGSSDVERVFRTVSGGDDWRDRIHQYWSGFGLASALQPAAPLQLTMQRRAGRPT